MWLHCISTSSVWPWWGQLWLQCNHGAHVVAATCASPLANGGRHVVLCCVVAWRVVLCSALLFCSVLSCFVLSCSVLFRPVFIMSNTHNVMTFDTQTATRCRHGKKCLCVFWCKCFRYKEHILYASAMVRSTLLVIFLSSQTHYLTIIWWLCATSFFYMNLFLK